MSPSGNKNLESHGFNWDRKKAKIFGNNTILYENLQEKTDLNILFLHAYGYGCDGTDWNLFVKEVLKGVKANVYSVDLPGFGNS